jgi:hypothetical protein
MAGEIYRGFGQMGARVRIVEAPQMNRRIAAGDGSLTSAPILELMQTLAVDVRRDKRGEYFHVRHDPAIQLSVEDVQPMDRHLLLSACLADANGTEQTRSAFLCGHDEQSWFVAAIPEEAEAADVQSAKDALKPEEVWEAIREHNVPMEQRDQRRTAAFIRQGEWFFLPRKDMVVRDEEILRNEPIQRGAGKPHRCQFLYREAGESVWVSPAYPNGLTEREFRQLPRSARRSPLWEYRVRGARVFAKGNIRHLDHKTVWLSHWHEVVMNTETRSRAMSQVAFLD